jgi:hypothetical protein
MPKKEDDVSPEHLDWLIQSRGRIQSSSVKLYRLMDEYPDRLKGDDYLNVSQALVATAFSLWRAAFLADKTGMRDDVFEDAKSFLSKVIVDNAIGFSQDRTHRDWTFNYYVSSAESRLRWLSNNLLGFQNGFSRQPFQQGGKSKPKQRWEICQDALETALDRLADSLSAKRKRV